MFARASQGVTQRASTSVSSKYPEMVPVGVLRIRTSTMPPCRARSRAPSTTVVSVAGLIVRAFETATSRALVLEGDASQGSPRVDQRVDALPNRPSGGVLDPEDRGHIA